MQKSYEWIKECFYRVSAKAIIRNTRWEFLLSHEASGYWDIPGWWIDHGETPHEALKREIMEEMWLTVTKISEHAIYNYLAESSWLWPYWKIPIWMLLYEVEVENYDFTPSDECTEIWFFSCETAQDMQLYTPNKEILREIKKQGT